MAKLQFLTILLVVTCFLSGVVSVTDTKFKDRFNRLEHQILQLKQENAILKEENERQNSLFSQLMSEQDVARETEEIRFVTETIAFTAVLTPYSSIPVGSTVLFNQVLLNEGDGYDNTTGTFTAPPGGDGFYYFSVYLTMTPARFGFFDIQVNGEIICTAYGDTDDSTFVDTDHASCSAAALITEGDTVQVVYRDGNSQTPLWPNGYYNGFTGFRL